MDWLYVSSSIVGLLMWFMTKTGEGFAQKAGEEVYKFLKARFKNDEEATTNLSYFSKNPGRYKDVLIDIVKERAVMDNEFGKDLLALLEKNQGTGTDGIRVKQIAVGNGIAQAVGKQASANVSLDKTDLEKKDKKKR